jgi:hypothetical protein
VTIKRDSADVLLVEGPVGAIDSPTYSELPFPQYSGPGFVEIKPHSAEQIRLGLAEIGDRRVKRAKEGRQGEAYLLTYTYRSEQTIFKSTPGKSSFTGHLLKPGPKLLKAFTELAQAREDLKSATKEAKEAAEEKEKKAAKEKEKKAAEEKEKASRAVTEMLKKPGSEAGSTKWLDNLGPWWPLKTHQISEPNFFYWRRWAGHGAGGSMLEHLLRNKFIEKYDPLKKMKKHLTPFKAASDWGEDIDFQEIAEFLYELEAALGRAA